MKPMVAVRRSIRCLSSAVLTVQCAACPAARHFVVRDACHEHRARKTHDAATRSNPRGAFVGTMLVAGIGKFRKPRAGGAGTLSGQFRLRVLGQAFSTSPFLFWGSLKPRFLFRREREKAVSGRLPRRRRRRKSPCAAGAAKHPASGEGHGPIRRFPYF